MAIVLMLMLHTQPGLAQTCSNIVGTESGQVAFPCFCRGGECEQCAKSCSYFKKCDYIGSDMAQQCCLCQPDSAKIGYIFLGVFGVGSVCAITCWCDKCSRDAAEEEGRRDAEALKREREQRRLDRARRPSLDRWSDDEEEERGTAENQEGHLRPSVSLEDRGPDQMEGSERPLLREVAHAPPAYQEGIIPAALDAPPAYEPAQGIEMVPAAREKEDEVRVPSEKGNGTTLLRLGSSIFCSHCETPCTKDNTLFRCDACPSWVACSDCATKHASSDMDKTEASDHEPKAGIRAQLTGAKGVNIRDAPHVDAASVGTISVGEETIVVASEGDWLQTHAGWCLGVYDGLQLFSALARMSKKGRDV